MATIVAEIPNVIIASEFPDRNKIKVLSEWKPDNVYSDLETYHVSRYNLITVEFPVDLFSYDEKKKTLSHLTFPKFYLKVNDSYLSWYITGPNTEEVVTDEIWECYHYFINYLCANNLMSDRFESCTGLKQLGYSDWHQYPHPNKYYYSHGDDVLHCLHRFDPSKYQVRRSEHDNTTLELVNLADNSVFVSFEIHLAYDWINKRYNLGL